jgi:group I intron endonuclease
MYGFKNRGIFMITGIYKLDFPGTNKVYVGQAKDIKKRFWEHIYSFKNNDASKKLLQAYVEYGEPTYSILCECSESELNSLENEAIEIFAAVTNGFNTFHLEGGSIRSQSGLDHSNSKYSKILLLKVFSYLYKTTLPYAKIAEILRVNKYLVNNIAYGSHRSWLEKEYPEQYSKFLSNKAIRNSTNLKTLKEVQYIKSPGGEVYPVQNISEFCRKQPSLADNVESARSSIAKVLKGTRSSHKGWTLAEKI